MNYCSGPLTCLKRESEQISTLIKELKFLKGQQKKFSIDFTKDLVILKIIPLKNLASIKPRIKEEVKGKITKKLSKLIRNVSSNIIKV